MEALGEKAAPTTSDWNQLKSLRTQLPHASVTIYQYKPLVGMTNKFSPTGLEKRYTYDAFNRLEQETVVEGGAQHVIKKYEYKNETEQ